MSLFTDAFPPEEFAARRAKVLTAIGDGIAVLQGATEYPAYVAFRQNNQFFYLTGVEVPRAIVLLDGRSQQTTLFLPARNERAERSEGPLLVPGDEAARLTGIANVRPRDEFAAAFDAAAEGGARVYAVPCGEPRRGHARRGIGARRGDGGGSLGRPALPRNAVRRAAEGRTPGIDVKDLDPVLDTLRLIKSPRELAVLREATRLSGLGLMEGIRNAHPGMREHEVAAMADYVFARGGSQGIAYFPLVATGTNAFWPHYHAGAGELKPGDLVLFDYAPDYKYYSADVTRMFPASGTFSPAQRELYTIYLRLYQALMTSIRPNAAPRDIIRDAVAKMDAILSGFRFSSDTHRRVAEEFIERLSQQHEEHARTHGRHGSPRRVPADRAAEAGDGVHDRAGVDDRRGSHLRASRDMILVTETGYENLSAFVPAEPDAIEKLMAETGRFEDRPVSGSVPGRGPSLPRASARPGVDR